MTVAAAGASVSAVVVAGVAGVAVALTALLALGPGLGFHLARLTPVMASRRRRTAGRRPWVVLGVLGGAALLLVLPWPVAPVVAAVAIAAAVGLALAVPPAPPDAVEMDALVLDVIAAGLEAGAAPARALRSGIPVAAAGLAAALQQVADRLDLGVEPARAWGGQDGDPGLAPLARVMVRATVSGASPVPALRAEARQRRELRASSVRARAGRVSALATLPLGLCFLPAFVLLGVVPLVATLVAPLLGLLS